MKKTKTSTKVIIPIIIITILTFLILAYGLPNNKKNNFQDKYINNSVQELKDKNRFMTITSAVNSYVTAVKYEDIDSIMSILDKKYVEEKEISSSDVLYKIDNYNLNHTTSIRAVHQVKSYNNIYIYYVKANLIEESNLTIQNTYLREIFYKVTINENTLAFAVAPISEKEYLNGVDIDG